MPIQINEIIIRAVIQDAQDTKNKTPDDGGGKEAIIAECVEQVLEILKNKKER